ARLVSKQGKPSLDLAVGTLEEHRLHGEARGFDFARVVSLAPQGIMGLANLEKQLGAPVALRQLWPPGLKGLSVLFLAEEEVPELAPGGTECRVQLEGLLERGNGLIRPAQAGEGHSLEEKKIGVLLRLQVRRWNDNFLLRFCGRVLAHLRRGFEHRLDNLQGI